jgi:hypothetical protein
MLKFHRLAFGDTKFKDIPLIGSSLKEAKREARDALYARFTDMRAAGKSRQAPHSATLLDENDHVVARFEVQPAISGRGEQAMEIPPEIWLDRMPGTPSPEIRKRLQARDQ